MGRPINWEPLCPTDPVPGDPDQVERSGREYQRVADAIEASVARLTHIADQAEMQSDAVDAFRDQARQVASDIRRAQHRYRGVGDALVAYSEPLRIAQDDSARALAAARDAEADLQAAQTKAAAGRAEALRAPTGADVQDVNRTLSLAAGVIEEAQHRLEQARARCRRAQEDRDHAAARAVASIRTVESSGDLNDSWWDDWGSEKVASITKWAGRLATAAGVLALLLGWIPVIGQALAAILGTIALIASLVSLAGNLALASNGDGEWSAVVFDAISVATFGVGRAVGGGARLAYGATKGSARLAAGRVAAGPASSRALAGLPGGSSASAIRAAIGPVTARLSRSAAGRLVAARCGSPISLRAPFTTAVQDVRGLPRHLVTVVSPGNLLRAVQETFRTVQSFVHGAAAERLAILLNDAEALKHARFVQQVPQGLRGLHEVDQQIRQAAVLTGVGSAAAGVSTAVDAIQGTQWAQAIFGPPGPTAEQILRLPEVASVR